MNYKYSSQIAALALTQVQCPCQDAAPRSGPAYRLVEQPANDEKNFVPRTLVPGVKRIIKTITPTLSKQEIQKIEDGICNDWGISLHTNPEASRLVCRKYKKLPYTHVAELELKPAYGVCTPVDPTNHFNLHEAVGVDLCAAITQVQPL